VIEGRANSICSRSFFERRAHFLCGAQQISESQILNANPLCKKLGQLFYRIDIITSFEVLALGTKLE
jgi:hypothetical protein